MKKIWNSPELIDLSLKDTEFNWSWINHSSSQCGGFDLASGVSVVQKPCFDFESGSGFCNPSGRKFKKWW